MEELIEIIENYIEADEINADTRFKRDLGVSSFDVVCISSEIGEKLGVNVEPADFKKYKTVGAMAEYIDSLKK